MTPEDFIGKIKISLKKHGYESIIRSLEKPAGRKPEPEKLKLSEWYNKLDQNQKEMVNKVILETIDATVFSFLCILDNVRFIEDDEEKTCFNLYASKNGINVLINNTENEELHNIYKEIVL